MGKDTELHKAAHQGTLSEVQSMVDGGEDVNVCGAADRTPLHRAAGAGHLDVCKFLVSKGAIVDQEDKSKRTPLHWASISGRLGTATFLVEEGAKLSYTTKSGETALHLSCEAGKVDIVRMIIEKAGQDTREVLFEMKNGDGKVPFDLAMAKKHKAVVVALKETGDKNAASASCVVS